jgi:ATP-dependent Clp protease ATP-binding subunit ClpA
MFERFTGGARAAVAQAQEHARRLGHRYIGCEHLLLAAVSTGGPTAAALRQHGVTPEAVETEIVRLIGLGQAASLFSALDRATVWVPKTYATRRYS